MALLKKIDQKQTPVSKVFQEDGERDIMKDDTKTFKKLKLDTMSEG